MHFWDLGGSPSVRTLWSKYYDESDAVVWVVDARHYIAFHTQAHDDKGKGKAKAPDAGTEANDAREASWKLMCKSDPISFLMDHVHADNLHTLYVYSRPSGASKP